MFSQTEILLMILPVSVLLILILILTFLDIKEYRKNKNIIEEKVNKADENIDKSNEEKEEVRILEVEEQNNNYIEKENSDNELIFEEEEFQVEDEIVPIKIENNDHDDQKIYEEYIEKESVPKSNNLNEELVKIQETMVDENDIEEKIVSFEEEQERTAIISLDELMMKSDELYNKNELVQYDDGDEPISLNEVINMYNNESKEINIPEVSAIVEETENKKDLYTKKEEIPFISSIYGMEKNEMSFENTATYEKLDRAKSNEFMRELRKKIENQ